MRLFLVEYERGLCICLLIFFLSNVSRAQVPLSALVSNNTSACSARGVPAYCRSAFTGNRAMSSNVEAQTPIVNPVPGNVNFSDLHALFPPDTVSKILFHYQPWFESREHISVGYEETDEATVRNQIARMIALGGYGMIVDWYGSRHPSQRHHLDATNVIARYLNSCFPESCPFRMAIMEDKGALSRQCPKGNKDQTSCLAENLNADMDYIEKHYASQPWYLTQGGNPIVLFFLHEPDWPGSDWNRIWSEVKSHTSNYPHPFKFVFEEEDVKCWKHTQGDGCYAWMNPAKWSPTAQFFWGASSNPKPVYYQDFYKNAVANSDKIAIGAIKKGFDDNNASWGTNRVTAQQCGQTLLKTIGLIGNYYDSRHPLEFLGMPTWNDYEEASEVETGIDNCYTISASISGNVVGWSLNPIDSYATTATVDHFTVYYGDARDNLYVLRDDVPVNTTSLDLTGSLPPGTWNIYVRMVAKALFMNRMSQSVRYSTRAAR